MDYDKYRYPEDQKVLSSFDGAFDSAYVIFNPFIEFPEDIQDLIVPQTKPTPLNNGFVYTNSFYADNYEHIESFAKKCSWKRILELSGLKDVLTLNQALRSSIHGIRDEISNHEAAEQFTAAIESQPIFKPSEGEFSYLIINDIIAAFAKGGFDHAIYIPELGEAEKKPLIELADDSLSCGTLISEDESFLFTTHWDYFYTLFCGEKKFIESVVEARLIEGFFLNPEDVDPWYLLPKWTEKVALELWEQEQAQRRH